MDSKQYLRFYYLLFSAAVLVYVTGFFVDPALSFILASLIVSLLVIFRIDDPFLRHLILIALVLRVGLALVQAFTAINLPGAGADSTTFEVHGWRNAQGWLNGIDVGKTTGAYYYSSWIGIVYLFFGRVPLIPQLVNVYFSLLSIWLLYKTVFTVSSSLRASRIAALILFLIPSLNAFSAILLRESMLLFFMLLSFYYLVRWINEGKLVLIGYSSLALIPAGMLHGVMILLLVINLFVLCFYSPKDKQFRFVLWQLGLALFLALGALFLIGNFITYQLPGNLAEIITPDHIRTVVESKTIGRSSYLQHIVPYTHFDLLWQTPLRIVYFLFAPFPWAIATLRDILGFFDVLLYTVLFYFSILGGRLLWYKNRVVVLAAAAVFIMLVVMFSWGTTNYGTAWRHKQKLAPFVIVLAAPAMAGISRERKVNLRPD